MSSDVASFLFKSKFSTLNKMLDDSLSLIFVSQMSFSSFLVSEITCLLFKFISSSFFAITNFAFPENDFR